jgi:predicted TIM-barrel fold metal-dependent hydrolase
MYEGHPGGRISWMPHKLDHGYFKPFWEFMAEHKVPITSHLANPVEYWKDESLKDAYKNGAPQEEYFRQAEAVLEKYPTLQISYAHFMFMGPQLDRLGKLFARFPGLRVDLAPGGEYFYYLSDNVSKAREFFIQWQDRILLGTDISDRNAMRLAHAKTDVHRLFLETDETFVLPSSTAMDQPPAAGSNGRTELKGLNLPLAVLEKIMGNNFEVFAGKDPKPLPQK